MPPASMKGMEMKKYGKGLSQTSVYRIIKMEALGVKILSVRPFVCVRDIMLKGAL